MKKKIKILVITPVHHIAGVTETLESIGEVSYLDDPSSAEVVEAIVDFDAIYTNPNKSKVYIGREIIDAGIRLNVICTASTGTVHIDKIYAAEKRLPILSLTEEREVIEKISSTAEHAFALTMATLRRVPSSHDSVLKGAWDYTQFIGRQMNCLTVGIIGYGRLGSKYAKYCAAFGSKVVVYDPYKEVKEAGITQLTSLEELVKKSDIVSIHVHVTPETTQLFSDKLFALMKNDVIIINTARGEVMDEGSVVRFLEANPMARLSTDVLADEQRNRLQSPILQLAKKSAQVLITPHIGGMTREAQEIAYGHAASMLSRFFANFHELRSSSESKEESALT